MPPAIRQYRAADDEPWAERFLEAHLGGRRQARRGEVIDVLAPGLGLVVGDGTGLLTYRIADGELELTALGAEPRRQGTGTALVAALLASARANGISRIWVVTTNDNLEALAFYQRHGFRITEIRVGAVDEARRTLKPAIPEVGEHGIGVHDEIELATIVSDH